MMMKMRDENREVVKERGRRINLYPGGLLGGLERLIEVIVEYAIVVLIEAHRLVVLP